MFGYLRFILALFVLFNHLPTNTIPFELAVTAVVIFYLISGYTMGLKFKKFQTRTTHPKLLFFIDRLIRVFPLYLFFILLNASLLLITEDHAIFEFNLSLKNSVANILLLPVNFYMFTNIKMILPITYSLALEEQFYLLMPLILSYKKLMRPLIFMSGALVLTCLVFSFSLSDFQLIGLNFDQHMFNDYLIYRLLPGVMIVFLLGVSLDLDQAEFKKNTLWIWIFFVILFMLAAVLNLLRMGQIFAVIFGVMIGVPIILFLQKLNRTHLDDYIGGLAYPIFLSQGVVIALLKYLLIINKTKVLPYEFNLLALAGTLILSFLSYFIFERKLMKLRSGFVNYFVKKYPR